MVHYRGGRAAIDASVYPDLDGVLERPHRRVPRGGAAARRARLHVPPARRHEPRVPERPAAARVRRLDRRRPGRAARRVHPAHQRGARRPARRDDASRRTCAAGTSARRGSPRAGYDFVAEALFDELEVDGFFMEWDDERSGGFEPLRFLPKGDKQVVLGLVTTKRGELESKDELKRRIEEATPLRAARAALPLAAVRLLVDRRRQRPDATTSRSRSCASSSRWPTRSGGGDGPARRPRV